MRIVPLLGAALLVGCPSVEREPPTCEEREDFACFRGFFRDLVGNPVEDLELCTPDLPDVACAVTGDDGGWQLPGLPRDADVVVTAEHPDYVPTVFGQNTSMDWYDWHKVAVSPWVMNQNADRLDVELDPERGQLLFLTWEGLNLDGVDTPRVQGVTATLAGGEVFYADAIGLASASATATTASGSGGALNLAPGTARLELAAPEGRCDQEPSFHFAFDGSVVPVPILAGFTTAIDVICPVP